VKPWEVQGEKIKDTIEYLRIIQNPSDNVSLQRVINEPKRGIGATSLEKVANIAEANDISMYEVIKNAETYGLNKVFLNSREFVSVIEELSSKKTEMLVSDIIKEVLNKTGYTKALELENDMDTGMTLYPVAHMVWEKVKGSSRGMGAVRNVISNQIEINKIATRRALAVKISAFPKLAVNKDFVDNPNALEKVGSTIKLKGGAQLEDIRKQIGYLSPASM